MQGAFLVEVLLAKANLHGADLTKALPSVAEWCSKRATTGRPRSRRLRRWWASLRQMLRHASTLFSGAALCAALPLIACTPSIAPIEPAAAKTAVVTFRYDRMIVAASPEVSPAIALANALGGAVVRADGVAVGSYGIDATSEVTLPADARALSLTLMPSYGYGFFNKTPAWYGYNKDAVTIDISQFTAGQRFAVTCTFDFLKSFDIAKYKGGWAIDCDTGLLPPSAAPKSPARPRSSPTPTGLGFT